MNDLINGSTMKLFKNNKRKIATMQDVDLPFFLYIYGLICKRIKWDGLEKPNSERLLEQYLFFNGMAVYFKFGGQYLILPCVNVGTLDMQGDVTCVRPITWNSLEPNPSKSKKQNFVLYVKDVYDENGNIIHEQDAVLIRNNDWSISTYWYIYPYLEQIKYTFQSKNISQVISRVKYLLRGDKESMLKLENVFEKVLDSAKPYLTLYDGVGSVDTVGEITKSNVAFDADTYWYDIDKTLNFLLTLLGIDNNLETKKKARLNVAEVESNNAVVECSGNIWLDSRIKSCEEIKSLFGVDISCRLMYNEDTESEEFENEETNRKYDGNRITI